MYVLCSGGGIYLVVVVIRLLVLLQFHTEP